ncbi:MAG: tetratricopeptide repeat protein [Planctomycetota bacterium]
MTKRQYLISWLLLGNLVIASTVQATEDGQAALDEAMEIQLQASTVEELGEVVSLCEKAIDKGLGPQDEAFAIQLLTGTLYKRIRPQVRLLVEATRLMPLNPKLEERRQSLLSDLRKILKYDATFGRAHLLMAQLQAIGDGDRQKARESIKRAIELLANDREGRAKALLVRGQLQEDEESRLRDFDRAVELNPDSAAVWKTRALYFLKEGQVDKAISDFKTLLKKDEDNMLARLAIAEALLKLDKIDEAMEQVNEAIENKPNVLAFKLRAQLWTAQEELDKALEDIDQAIEMEPKDPELFLMRARLYYIEGRNALAKSDVNRVLEVIPGFPAALELRSSISASLGQFEEAIQDLNTLLQRNSGNPRHELQLAIYLNAAGNSREAIEVFTNVLESEPANAIAIRGRADAYLSIGAHKKAIADYEAALKSSSDDSGVLNNFAWVLATSPDDTLRDGSRALELARKACELTDYKEAHILSTLAAAHAENGDFEKAVEWSNKACELGDENVEEQLKQELESYKNGEPWRERKTEEEGEAESESQASGSG